MQTAAYKRCTKCANLRPMTAFHANARYRDGREAWCRHCKTAAGKAARARLRTESYAQRRDAATRRAAIYARRLPSDFGHWLAGFIDGEGCFYIPTRQRGAYRTYGCSFALALRDDDRPILAEIRETTAIGRIYASPKRRRPGWNDAAMWAVASKADCLALVAILDRFPLRSKKARDFAVWRRGVELWALNYHKRYRADGPDDWLPFAEIAAELKAVRAYR